MKKITQITLKSNQIWFEFLIKDQILSSSYLLNRSIPVVLDSTEPDEFRSSRIDHFLC